jgi:hypothetical protein
VGYETSGVVDTGSVTFSGPREGEDSTSRPASRLICLDCGTKMMDNWSEEVCG